MYHSHNRIVSELNKGSVHKRYLTKPGLFEFVHLLFAPDFIFPYGKTVVEGAPTVEGTWEDLYGY